jgi:hypothetical protein
VVPVSIQFSLAAYHFIRLLGPDIITLFHQCRGIDCMETYFYAPYTPPLIGMASCIFSLTLSVRSVFRFACCAYQVHRFRHYSICLYVLVTGKVGWSKTETDFLIELYGVRNSETLFWTTRGWIPETNATFLFAILSTPILRAIRCPVEQIR